MAAKKIIAVVGATGAQGGGLVRAILNDPGGGFTVRALTRDPDSEKAQALAQSGALVMRADLDDEASLGRAFAGAHGVYCVTFFWEHFSAAKEKAHARNMAAAAKAEGVKHAIWSTLEDTRQWIPLTDKRMPTLMGGYKVPHFDAKGESNKFFTEIGVPTTFLYPSFYWENLIHFGMGPKRDAAGKLVFTLPLADKKMPSMAAEDIGRCAYGIFKKNSKYIGKRIGVAAAHMTGAQMVQALSDALGQEVRYQAVSPEAYRSSGVPGAEDLGNMFQFFTDCEKDFCGMRSVDTTRALNPALQSFDAWLAENKARIPLQ